MIPSIFSILKMAVGPSSSHTLGAIRSAKTFIKELDSEKISKKSRIQIELLGSFALTGKGHLTDQAALAGLTNYEIGSAKESISDIYNRVQETKKILIKGKEIYFEAEKDILWNINENQLKHPNTIRFYFFNKEKLVKSEEYLSIGGGEILNAKEMQATEVINEKEDFKSFSEIMQFCQNKKISLLDFTLEHEKEFFGLESIEVYQKIGEFWEIMKNSIENGLNATGILPGSLQIKRRAKEMYEEYLKSLREWRLLAREITLASIYGIAVSEENADGKLIIAAPTCGSAGIIPSVFKILQDKYHIEDKKILDSLIVAALIGAIVKMNASISGAEVGCQGEVGTASSMAAAGVCFVLGGNLFQIESAAEIALEHHLGLTCDPIDGLVQVPCIERNGVGAITALNAANIALLRRSPQRISFDNVVNTMKQIGDDMNPKYKETSLGGLAKNYKANSNN